MQSLKQLLKEFFLPLAVALTWTLYNIYELPQGQWSIRNFVNVFGPSFFFASWLAAQWHRVKKQQKIEAGLTDIEASVNRTLQALEEKTVDLVSHITGGESVCYLIGPQPVADIWKQLVLVHVGKHLLYEISARIVDLDEFEKIKDHLTINNIQQAEFQRQYGNLIAGHVQMIQENIVLGSGNSRRFNIFFTGRNGGFTQLLRCRRVAGTWLFAIKVVRNDNIFFESIPEGYPRESDGSVDWDGYPPSNTDPSNKAALQAG